MFLHLATPNKNLYTRTMLHGIGRAEGDAQLRANFRTIIAILIAYWVDDNPEKLTGITGDVCDVIMSQKFYEEGYNKTVAGNDERLWFCSYVGFEKVTSEWAKKNHPDCHGVFCMRIINRDSNQDEVDAHTIQIYF